MLGYLPLEKGKSNEKRLKNELVRQSSSREQNIVCSLGTYRNDTEFCLAEDVARGSPVLLEDTATDYRELSGHWGREFIVNRGIVRIHHFRSVVGKSSQLDKLVLNITVLRTLATSLMPVNISVLPGSCSNDFQHVLGWIRHSWTGLSAIFDEVVHQNL